MPQEFLHVSPTYVFVGAYRLLHDPQLWKPMWAKCSKAAKRASLIAGAWAFFTWPIQKWFVSFFMSTSASVTGMKGIYNTLTRTADRVDDPLGFTLPLPSLTTFAAMVFVASQCQTIIEFFLRRQLAEYRNKAYDVTVASRGKTADWWIPYQEEWEEPPYEKAQKNSKKAPLYRRLASPIITRVMLRVVLLPLDFIPFLSLAVGAYLRSFSYGRQLLTPFFAAKRMTPMQVDLFMTERQFSLRAFGFACATAERMPLIGIALSISNRVGAAMLAHDLEKRQHAFASGELKKLTKEETYNLGEIRGWKDLARPSSPSSSQRNKLPFAPQGENDFVMPGATVSPQAAAAEQARRRQVASRSSLAGAAVVPPPLPSRPAAAALYDDVPPAYTEQDARQAVGGQP
ncbi:hypothetical protein K437DRAFT_674 [Tilletiaria anomala UBC 951]|uniref:Uncharacterized protein n=1 Tax=Tilletiaria anomala (strain ATCC 24038 / CBS 436.72 / UBC 951) TaxID=1037660 RepID=A0A066WI60_TILAU|nr:uncharacterized protein K437DRAFT_674 [Tilletiaria anomala UBC 951]KDN53521.1 hypothetical protein K437DRAFT_674 [Tilletiaria anomala UBC 951]